MIFNLFRKPVAPHAVDEAYRSIVAQSRQPVFYAEWGVPDTVTGRFDMVSVHLAAMLHRLRQDPKAAAFTQALVDTFFLDMDRSVRELGVSDIGVPRKVKTMGNLFYGLADSLGAALDSGDAAEVETVLARNVYAEAGAGSAQLAAYLIGESKRLAATPAATLTGQQGAAA